MATANVDHMQVDGSATPTAPVVGMIYPPPDIRKTVDRAAQFLATKGPQLEDRIRENEKHNARFCFLNPTDPYHAYYQYKLREARAVGTTGNEAAQQDTSSLLLPPQEPEQQEPARVAPPQPESYEFSAPMPAMSAQDLDIIKLTARFAARNGRHFISQLAQRESRNFQFDFLRPSHSLFPYFTELIKQYSKALVPSEDIKEKLLNNKNRTALMERIRQRVEWTVWDEQEKRKKAEEDEKEKLAYASIDWHNFVVVETVEFTAEDEKMNLPAPMTLQELENMSLAQKRMASLSAMQDHEIPDFAAYEKALAQELGHDVKEEIKEEVKEEIKEEEMTEDQDIKPTVKQDEIDEQQIVQPHPANLGAPIKIRTDYKPKLGQQTKVIQETQVCPRCGESIPVSEMDEHMRIELLDPKWKEQKLAQEAKLRDSNLLQEGTDMAKILKNFLGYRSDISGAEETEIGKKIAEEHEQQRALWEQQNAQAAAASSIDTSQDVPSLHGNSAASSTSASISALPSVNNLPNQLASNNTLSSTMDATTAAIRKAEDDLSMHDAKRQKLHEQQPISITASPVASSQPVDYPPANAPLPRSNTWTPQQAQQQQQQQQQQQPTTPTIKLMVQAIDYPEKPEWNLKGQIIELNDLPLTTMISTVKERISSQIGMPYGKQKLSLHQTALVNSKSLGFYGCTDGTMLTLGLRKK